MKAGLIIIGIATAVLIYALVRIADFGAEGSARESDPLPQASAPDFCPRYDATRLPPQFVLRSRTTRNLGNEVMGRSYVYGDGRRAVEVHVGFDALDLYEDLDFVGRPVDAGGVDRTLHVPSSLGSGGFLGLTWDEPDEEGPCAELTLIGRRVDQSTLLDVAAGLRRVGG
jgi:hypothetical protein